MPVWEAIGWLGSAVIVFSMLQRRITRLRAINLVGCALAVAYNWALGVWPMVALNSVLAVIQVVHLIGIARTRHDPSAYSVVRAAPGDDVVTTLLQRHRVDIERFTPLRVVDGATMAFVVMSGDTVIGAVLAHEAEPGVAQVDLDWVAPAYRDFTPGEFVFARSGVWQERGVRIIRVPADGGDYYPNVGFVRRGDLWERQLAA